MISYDLVKTTDGHTITAFDGREAIASIDLSDDSITRPGIGGARLEVLATRASSRGMDGILARLAEKERG